jgi:hypothetical protein
MYGTGAALSAIADWFQQGTLKNAAMFFADEAG